VMFLEVHAESVARRTRMKMRFILKRVEKFDKFQSACLQALVQTSCRHKGCMGEKKVHRCSKKVRRRKVEILQITSLEDICESARCEIVRTYAKLLKVSRFQEKGDAR